MGLTVRFEIFPSELDATADFYRRVLGFRVVDDRHRTPEPYLTLQRDGVLIGAALREEVGDRAHRRPPVGVELVLEVDDLDAELERVRAAGWPVDEPARLRPWGLRDFRLLDPSGYYLRVTTRGDTA